MALSESVRASINEEMKRRKLSQREVARRVGMGQQYFWRRCSMHETADMEFTPSELERVAEAIGVPVSRFLRVPGQRKAMADA